MLALLLSSRHLAILAAAALGVALVVGAIAWLRADSARDARNEDAARAAVQEQEIRREADDAARDAERDGALERLRQGRF